MNADEILKKLKESGKITDADIYALDVSEEMKNLTDIVFLLFSPKYNTGEKHEYYTERSKENAWELPVHKKWVAYTAELINYLGCSAPKDAAKEIAKLSRIYKEIGSLGVKLLTFMDKPDSSDFVHWINSG